MFGISIRIPVVFKWDEPRISVKRGRSRLRGVKIIHIEVPEDYPGLNEEERQMLNDGLSMCEQAFITAMDRLEKA